MATKKNASGGTFKKFIIVLAVIIIVALGGTAWFYYLRLFGANVNDKKEYLYIHTGENYEQVYADLRNEGILIDTTTFNWAAHNMKYVDRVKPGKYRLHDGMSNRRLIRMLELGEQEAVTFSFHNIRLKEQFAGFVGKKLEPDST